MKTCLIYSPDGVDLDNAINLIHFYKRLGFRTFFSDVLVNADVLALLRAKDEPIDTAGCDFSLIHIYDYVGWNYDAAIRSFDYSKTFICCTTEERRQEIIEGLDFPEDHIRIAFMHVEISVWTHKVNPVKYETVHIGNYKPIPEGDIIQDRFVHILEKYKVHVWGRRWNEKLNSDRYYGVLGLFSVTNIYSQSKFALGLMYPFQRKVTFSNRFWIASLCGCPLISEKGLYTKKLPGVIETDYTDGDYEQIINEIVIDREQLRQEAIAFWEKENEATLSYLKPSFNLVKRRKYSLSYRLRVYKLQMRNRRRILYHKSFVFNLMKKLRP